GTVESAIVVAASGAPLGIPPLIAKISIIQLPLVATGFVISISPRLRFSVTAGVNDCASRSVDVTSKLPSGGPPQLAARVAAFASPPPPPRAQTVAAITIAASIGARRIPTVAPNDPIIVCSPFEAGLPRPQDALRAAHAVTEQWKWGRQENRTPGRKP